MINPRWLTSSVNSTCLTFIANQDAIILPILADALADAGCDDDTLIQYLRTVQRVGGAALSECDPFRLLVVLQSFATFLAWGGKPQERS